MKFAYGKLQLQKHLCFTQSHTYRADRATRTTSSTSCTIIANGATMATITSVCAASALAKAVDTGSGLVGQLGYATNARHLKAAIHQTLSILMCLLGNDIAGRLLY
jgi:hypothetical protein